MIIFKKQYFKNKKEVLKYILFEIKSKILEEFKL